MENSDLSWKEIDIVEQRPIGRDPRTCSQDELNRWGHSSSPVLSIIRAKCLDCVGESPSEIRKCTAVSCPLWPYRMGTNPLRDKREMSEEDRKVVSERFRLARHSKISSQ